MPIIVLKVVREESYVLHAAIVVLAALFLTRENCNYCIIVLKLVENCVINIHKRILSK